MTMMTPPGPSGADGRGPHGSGASSAGATGARRGAARRGGALRWVLLALLLLPFVEVAVLVAVGKAVGFWWTLGLVVAVAVVGAWLSGRESGRTYRALKAALSSGRMPADEMTDAILVTLGGFLLILPGFLSDVLGLVLVLPFTRPVARRLLQAVVARQAVAVIGGPLPQVPDQLRRATSPGRGQVVQGEVVDPH